MSTKCIHGHEKTPENTTANGSCRTCMRKQLAEWQARNPQKRAASLQVSNKKARDTLADSYVRYMICMKTGQTSDEVTAEAIVAKRESLLLYRQRQQERRSKK